MKAWIQLISTVCFLIGAAPVSGAPQKAELKAATNGEKVEKENSGSKTLLNGEYEIGPGDQLSVSVWKEPELSRRVLVRPDGRISLPLIGDVDAVGRNPRELSEFIETELKKFVTAPTVAVMVEEASSRRVFVLGKVERPGPLTLTPGMTVLQALAGAGGFRDFAKVKKIVVMRKVDGQSIKYRFNYKQVINGAHLEQNITLKIGDSIIVP